MKKFIVRDGFSFLLDNGEIATGGDSIELPDDIAAQNDHRLEPVLTPKQLAKALEQEQQAEAQRLAAIRAAEEAAAAEAAALEAANKQA